MAKGERQGNSVLTSKEVYAVRKDERTLQEIGEDYGISLGTVHQIKTRKTWKHLQEIESNG